jgi:hypothetical protein
MRDPPCPDKPVAARLSVLDAVTGSVVTTVDSGADGRFSVAVSTGEYLLRLANAAGPPPRQANPFRVTVERGRYTTVTVRLDSGIRWAPDQEPDRDCPSAARPCTVHQTVISGAYA